jgi:hypothetical protein
VWRALWWPVVQALRLLLCAATLAGFGRDAAEHFWDATQ